MAKELTIREVASMGGRARSEKYDKGQLTAWATLGGRKPKLTKKEWKRVFAVLDSGKTHAECAREFGISTRTIGRAVARGGPFV